MNDDTEPTESSPPDAAAEKPRSGCRGRALFMIVLTIVVLLLVEGFSSLVLAVKATGMAGALKEEAHCRYDADLGWSHVPSASRPDLYGPGRSLTTNSQGFRGHRDYDEKVPEGTYRVICLGDSFTLGYGVDDAETYAARFDALDGVEAVNMGQGGFGVDQDYLWYRRDGVELECDLLLLAMIAPDFRRMNNRDFVGYAKPFLRAEDGEIVVENVPVPDTYESRTSSRKLGLFVQRLAITRLAVKALVKLGLAQPAKEKQTTLGELEFDEEVARLILDDLARISAERGQDFALVYLPLNRLMDSEPNIVTTFLREYSADSGVPLIELTEDFAAVPTAAFGALFQPDNHYTAEGHELAAKSLLRQLRARFPAFPR